MCSCFSLRCLKVKTIKDWNSLIYKDVLSILASNELICVWCFMISLLITCVRLDWHDYLTGKIGQNPFLLIEQTLGGQPRF